MKNGTKIEFNLHKTHESIVIYFYTRSVHLNYWKFCKVTWTRKPTGVPSSYYHQPWWRSNMLLIGPKTMICHPKPSHDGLKVRNISYKITTYEWCQTLSIVFMKTGCKWKLNCISSPPLPFFNHIKSVVTWSNWSPFHAIWMIILCT
jgi:hypothetical protein